jgi:hypothetical protein
VQELHSLSQDLVEPGFGCCAWMFHDNKLDEPSCSNHFLIAKDFQTFTLVNEPESIRLNENEKYNHRGGDAAAKRSI